MIRRFWTWLWKPHSRYSLGLLVFIGGALGVVFWGGFNTFMEYTNRMEFCISCHEMQKFVYEDYTKTAHYANPSGVRAICSDCHVPKEWTAKLVRKIHATNELFHWLAGTVDTPEKFEAHRLDMAERVWASMKATDSRECRNCHSYQAMNFAKQHQNAQKVMKKALEKGRTCIECHRGIAHRLPDLMLSFKGSLAGKKVEAHSAVAVGPQSIPLTGDDGSALGLLLPGAPVMALSNEEARVRIEVKGWAPVSYRLIITNDLGARLSFADLTEAGKAARKIIGTAEDLYGEKWEEVSLTGWVAKSGLAMSVKPVWKLAADIYQNRCDSCHTAHAPGEYSVNQWPGELEGMADYGGLMDKELVLVRQYLQSHAKVLLKHRPAAPDEKETSEENEVEED